MRKAAGWAILAVLLWVTGASAVRAAGAEEYRVVVEDAAELLTEAERSQLEAWMQPITAYGNVAFVTTDRNQGTSGDFAKMRYRKYFGRESGTLFLIDMRNRNIWIYSDGAVYRTVTRGYADTITDNVYRYASQGEYYECAAEAYREILELLEGNRIAQPMKYISNALLALILALFANLGLASHVSRLHRPSRRELLSSAEKVLRVTRPTITYTHETRAYDPVSSGSSGGSGGGGSGGGGGGGGGGHSF